MKPQIQLHEGEKILIECQPKSRLALYSLLTRYLRFLVVIAFFLVSFFLQSGGGEGMVFQGFHLRPQILALLILLFILISCKWMHDAVRKHWYFITNERCINFSGFWGINKQIILFNKIVDVNVRQTPLERLLGLSSVIVDVPGGYIGRGRSSGRILILGLSAEDAEKISHLIGEKMREVHKK